MQFVYPITAPEATNADRFGPKAANVARLGQAGLPIPDGFCLDAAAYRYLAESIRVHPDQQELGAMMESAGFDRVDWFNLSAGVVALHRGYVVASRDDGGRGRRWRFFIDVLELVSLDRIECDGDGRRAEDGILVVWVRRDEIVNLDLAHLHPIGNQLRDRDLRCLTL